MRIVVETHSERFQPRDLPQKGEVWLNVESGLLYEMRDPSRDGQPYRGCHKVGAPETDYGCDPSVECACWDDAVRGGQWVKVLNCPGQRST